MYYDGRKTRSEGQPRRRPSARRKGVIVGVALAVSVATGGVWGGGAPATAQAADCQPVFAGRAGVLPCPPPNSATDNTIEKVIGTTTVGCLLGFLAGGGVGAIWGCAGGAAGNIVW